MGSRVAGLVAQPHRGRRILAVSSLDGLGQDHLGSADVVLHLGETPLGVGLGGRVGGALDGAETLFEFRVLPTELVQFAQRALLGLLLQLLAPATLLALRAVGVVIVVEWCRRK